MRDAKTILLLIVSFLLLVVSCVLLWTWGYNYYQQNNADKKQFVMSTAAVLPVPGPDSLSPTFNTVVNQPDSHIDSIWNNADSLKGELNMKLNEFNRLRNEINAILNKPGSNAGLEIARQKINTLQQIVDDLRNRNLDVEKENNRLRTVLSDLSLIPKGIEQNYKTTGIIEKNQTDANTTQAIFTTSDLRLSAIMLNNEKEEETTQALQTDKLVGSFMVKNNSNQAGSTEMLVVIVQPDGQVLKGSSWESGIFNTPEGKKIYSYKLSFDLTRGESRRLLFTLSTDRYLKGNYSMQLYYNGMLIGKMLKTLS